MIRVVLLGAGNVAVHLAKAFYKATNIDFVQRYSRDSKNDSYFDQAIAKTHRLDKLAQADIYIIAINDDKISDFSKQLPISKGLVVHTSGSISLKALQCKANKGVFYPLQTFSKDQNIQFDNIPIAIETEVKKDFELLNNFANCLSKKVYAVNSSQREKLHIAAVFANNFSNHMFYLAKKICDENNFSFDILKPLIKETAEKVQILDPEKAQTGPAKRNDQKVLNEHLSALFGEQKEIYKLISNSIINSNKN